MLQKEEMEMLCELSKFTLTSDEMSKYSLQMEDIIRLMDTIGDSSFEYNPADMEGTVKFSDLRDDTVEECNSISEILSCSKYVRDNQFTVPKVVE